MDQDQQQEANKQSMDKGTASEAHKNLNQVKQEALAALAPALSLIKNVEPERKFELSINALRFTGSDTLAEAALQAALQLPDETAKAEALIELLTEINFLEKS